LNGQSVKATVDKYVCVCMCGPTTNNLQYIFYKILYSDSFEGALSTEIEYKKQTNKQVGLF